MYLHTVSTGEASGGGSDNSLIAVEEATSLAQKSLQFNPEFQSSLSTRNMVAVIYFLIFAKGSTLMLFF